MRFRSSARDLTNPSLIEAGVDDFSLVAPGQGCNSCAPVANVCTISVARSGDDAVISWSGLAGPRRVIYRLTGCGEKLKLGTTEGTSFVHEKALLSDEPFFYQVTTVDACGVEQPFCGETDCP